MTPPIKLKIAISQIQQACEDQSGKRLPFFFLVGAGISYPHIPLASEIEKHCKEVAQKYDRKDEPTGKRPMDIYSHWFNQAYPQPILRQKYLRELIQGKIISQANLRLAHLLSEKKIASLVVTPNFDDFLSRALTLFGIPHIVCDHPKTVERIHPEQEDVQIVHVYGTYWFYDCCNLGGEIEERAQSSAKTTLTMASLLDNFLSRRSPLVIGYSGWEGDVIMTALKRRLQSHLPYNLYWFCYKPANVNLLPDDWLKNHPDVYFVILERKLSRQVVTEKGEGQSLARDEMELSQYAEMKKVSEKESYEPTLSAEDVLEALIETFELDPPMLTKSPLEFFAKQLRGSLPQDEDGQREREIYFFNKVVEEVEEAKQLIEREKQRRTEAIQIIEPQLEKVRDAVRRSQYREAIQQANEIRVRELTETQLRELMNAVSSVTLRLYDASKEELDGYNLLIAIGNMLSEKNIDEPALREQVARALFNKGITLGVLNRSEEGIAVYDEVVKRFGEATEPALREQVARALFNKENLTN
ncbi:MAG: SIR2 family protein [Thermodesulfobacteriota bacterium]